MTVLVDLLSKWSFKSGLEIQTGGYIDISSILIDKILLYSFLFLNDVDQKVFHHKLFVILLWPINMMVSSFNFNQTNIKRIFFLLCVTYFQCFSVSCQEAQGPLADGIDKTSYCRFTPNHTLCLHYVSSLNKMLLKQ